MGARGRPADIIAVNRSGPSVQAVIAGVTCKTQPDIVPLGNLAHHLLQMLSLVAMEAPVSFEADEIRDNALGWDVTDFGADDFAGAFDAECRRHLSADDLNGTIQSDGELSAGEYSLESACQLRDAGPWGQGFPAPVFEGEFDVLGSRTVGECHLKLNLRPAPGNASIDAIAFNTQALPGDCRRARMVYRLEVNEYRGIESPQLVVEYIEGHTA